jgi:hypothetical protein
MLTLKEKISKLKQQYSESRDQSRSKSKTDQVCKMEKQRESGSLEPIIRINIDARNVIENLPNMFEKPASPAQQQVSREKLSLLNFLNGGVQIKSHGVRPSKSPTFIKLLPKRDQIESASERKDNDGPKELRTEVRRKYLERFKLLNLEYSINSQKKSSIISINAPEPSDASAVNRKDSLYSNNKSTSNLARTHNNFYNMYKQAKISTDHNCKSKELRPKQRKLYSSVISVDKKPDLNANVSNPDFEKSLHLHRTQNKPQQFIQMAVPSPGSAADKNFQMGEFMDYLKERLTKNNPDSVGYKSVQQKPNFSSRSKHLQKIRDPITSKKANPPILCYAVNSVSGSEGNFDRIAVFFKVVEWSGKKYPFSFFGLYRGDSSSRGANILKHNFHEWIISSPHFPSSVSSSILDAVSKANDQFVTEGEDRNTSMCALVSLGKQL